jgi:hypothetical protein
MVRILKSSFHAGAIIAASFSLSGAAQAQLFGGSTGGAGPSGYAMLVTDLGTFQSFYTGSYDANGNLVTNGGYVAQDPADGLGINDYFFFDNSTINAHITTASIQLYSFAISQPYTFRVGAYDDSPFAGNASASDLNNGFGDASSYTALGSGALYGTQILAPADASGTVTIALNQAAIDRINQGVDNFSQFFGVGGTATEAVRSVPEPANWALMLVGFGLVGGAMRSRRKAAISFG